MPNVTWLEPKILLDILALNLYTAQNNLKMPNEKELFIISPWISNFELTVTPGVWHQQLTIGYRETSLRLLDLIYHFSKQKWKVHIAILKYGFSKKGLSKDKEKYWHERTFLKKSLRYQASIYECPELHAKGVVTPLAIITGTTNYTHSGLYRQSQNANYFAFDHPEYNGNKIQLVAKLKGARKLSAKDL
ncbi:hypothetical protein [Candidatus Uabimicrobium amorphum]|uniref:Phospholipase D-like domain-containing protein n=1 Tax=Uabimicrobium amorphum TaxID=2596890 RepID=A0A5S9IS60_UABAM|nr:hypothetical protein [Candidatus Uabimicrobium amorphum]BBM87119.1 hypothetical protein UABAM_05522 [Candidatus Uabimicrobium amorphum]